ncbi:MAG: 60S ribosomal protein L31 [Candidatus Aenigmarchaeota archaeon]|nr:60S ribosomal protein L31 [Candidatus Aenigmarchaeota archaeon]
MPGKKETKTSKHDKTEKSDAEKIYNIKLTEAYKKAIRRRSPYAVRLVKDHVKKHSKAKEVKIGAKLNETIWQRGIKKPARSVRVNVVRDGDVAKVELMGFEYKEFKAKAKKERVGMKEKLLERLGPKALKKEEEEKKIEGKELPEETKKNKEDEKTEELLKEEAKTEPETEEKK